MLHALHLQERDLRCMADVGDHGVLDAEQLHARHFPGLTRRRCQQRLQLYRDHGLMRGVGLTVWYGDRSGGRIPIVYGLTERGASAVEQFTGARPIRWMRHEPKPETLHHRLAVVRTRIAFDDGCRVAELSAPQWILEQDRRDDARPEESPARQRVLYHEFAEGGRKFTCQPDAACLLPVPRSLARPQADLTPLLILWEVDRSTERRAQVVGKCPGYAALLTRQDYRRYWPAAQGVSVRIFVVCQSHQRIDSLVQAIRDQPVASYFRFASVADLKDARVITDPIWRTTEGQHRAIARREPASHGPLRTTGMPSPHEAPHRGP